jgi:prepilin-type N-terminal cleavage/methylation domain-containing protein
MKSNFGNKQAGFTLIELIVSIFIIGILAGITIVNFRASERPKRAQLAADTYINAIRNAQNFTLTGKKIDASTCVINGVADKSPQFYIIDFTVSQTSDLYGIDKCNQAYLIERYTLIGGTRIRQNGYVLNGTPAPAMQLRFAPPFGAIAASTSTNLNQGPFAAFTTATITIETTEGSNSKTITVDGVSGRIQ